MRDPLTVPNNPRDASRHAYQIAMADHLAALDHTEYIHRAFVALANQTLLTLSPKGTEN